MKEINMAKTATNTEAKAEEKKTRTVLTGAERIAKMEADLKAAREKEEAKAKAKLGAADEKVTAAEARVAKAQAKLDEAKQERDALRVAAGLPTDEQDTTES